MLQLVDKSNYAILVLQHTDEHHEHHTHTTNTNSLGSRWDIKLSWADKFWRGTGHLTEANLWWRTAFDGRQPWWKKIFDGNNLWSMRTFNGRWTFIEGNLWQKKTFDRGWPFVEQDIWQCNSQKIMFFGVWL